MVRLEVQDACRSGHSSLLEPAAALQRPQLCAQDVPDLIPPTLQ